MPDPSPDLLMETKLLIPRPLAGAVPRPRLDALLRRGRETTLTLVSAPAGFGKTTVLSAWLADPETGSAAWVSLDEQDQDPARFWSYVLAAVDRAAPGAATASLAQLQSGRVGIETVLTTLLNELSVLPDDLTIVLDDYHLADGTDNQPAMALLVDRLPPQVHLVISTRSDPALPLARLRVRGRLVEVRVDELRFTDNEAAAYLNDASDLDLASADVAALEARTEGWAAALQLAALSLKGRDDPSGFIAGFAGDDRFVVDYLADEVLDRQPPSVRRFLRESSVLERLSGPLCDAVTGRNDSQQTLESLERNNLFLIPLDAHRRWYRYHHLFADVLRARLLSEHPADVTALHRRASDWFDAAGHSEAAVRHALAAGDTARAADLVEVAIPALLRDRREQVVRRWATQLPAEAVADRPVLAVGLVGGLMASNDFTEVPDRLRAVDHMLAAPSDELVVHDAAAFSRLPAAVEAYRAALALVDGDLAGTREHARAALALATDDDHLTAAAAAALQGLTAWTLGDLTTAHAAYRSASGHLTEAGHIADVLGCAITLADLEMTFGRLGEAQQTLQGALDLADREPAVLRGTADMHVGLSRVALERGDLPAAADHLRTADTLGDTLGLPQNPYRWRVALGLLRAAEGDVAAALELLEEAQQVYVGDFSPNVRPIAATRARLLALTGDFTAALQWARTCDVGADDDLSYLHEYEHLSLARVLLASGRAADGSPDRARVKEATDLLDRLRGATEAGGRGGTLIEVLVVQSLAQSATGNRQQALDTLDHALRLAEPEAFFGVFLAEGPPMHDLLRQLTAERPDRAPARRLLTLVAPHENESEAAVAAGRAAAGQVAGGSGRQTQNQPLPEVWVEPLSRRELDVLRMLRSELDGPAIARHLGVSLATVRSHTQHIYTKLGVSNRRAAVRRAHQLNLFSTSAHP